MTSRAKSTVVFGGNGTEYGDVPTEEQTLAELRTFADSKMKQNAPSRCITCASKCRR